MVDTGRSIREVEMYLAGLSYRKVVPESARYKNIVAGQADERVSICLAGRLKIHRREKRRDLHGRIIVNGEGFSLSLSLSRE